MQQLKEISTHQRKKTNEMLASLLQDLNEIGQAIGSPIVENMKLGEKVEEEFTAARLMVAKAKAEVKNLVHRCQTLETSQMDCNKKVNKYNVIQSNKQCKWGLNSERKTDLKLKGICNIISYF